LSPKADYGSPSSSTRPPFSEQDDHDEGGEDDAGAEVGSIGSLDETAVDTDRPETRGIGHLGKASAADWQHRTEEIASKEINDRGNHRMLQPPIVSSYHTEDADIDMFDISHVDPYALPDAQLSGNLVLSYFEQVHTIFPILDKAEFLRKYHSFDRDTSRLSPEGVAWLTSLNIVFAISAYRGRLTKSRQSEDVKVHLVYCARATSLCAQQDIMLRDADLSAVEILGLLSLYFMATNRVNKCVYHRSAVSYANLWQVVVPVRSSFQTCAYTRITCSKCEQVTDRCGARAQGSHILVDLPTRMHPE
jgi:hypothetical protein